MEYYNIICVSVVPTFSLVLVCVRYLELLHQKILNISINCFYVVRTKLKREEKTFRTEKSRHAIPTRRK